MFCTSCGKQIPEGQITTSSGCPNCGRPILLAEVGGSSTSEEISAQIKMAQEVGFGKGSRYDLYFTASRLVAIKLAGAAVVGGAAFGLAGMMAERAVRNRQANKKRENMEPLSLDAMLASDPKSNYNIQYDTIQTVKVSSNMMQRSFEVKYGNGEKKKFFLDKDAVEELKVKLPVISGLEGKLELPKN